MTETAKYLAEWAATIIELIGVGLLVVLTPYALIRAALQWYRRADGGEIFRSTRSRMGRGILLGLEFLIAADIVHTVAVDLSFPSVGLLAVIIAVRTFLSFTIEVEINGRWPWQAPAPEHE